MGLKFDECGKLVLNYLYVASYLTKFNFMNKRLQAIAIL